MTVFTAELENGAVSAVEMERTTITFPGETQKPNCLYIHLCIYILVLKKLCFPIENKDVNEAPKQHEC